MKALLRSNFGRERHSPGVTSRGFLLAIIADRRAVNTILVNVFNAPTYVVVRPPWRAVTRFDYSD